MTDATAKRLALYFGPIKRPGHYLWNSHHSSLELPPGFPWSLSLLDTGLLRNRGVPEPPDGRVHWTCGGLPDLWHAFVWWDRSVDTRSACNSGFYVRGFGPAEVARANLRPAFEFACAEWPEIVARQHFPLVLVEAATSPRSGEEIVLCRYGNHPMQPPEQACPTSYDKAPQWQCASGDVVTVP